MDAYREAQRLYAATLTSPATGPKRVAVLERAMEWIGELVAVATPEQRPAVLLMNSGLADEIAVLREQTR